MSGWLSEDKGFELETYSDRYKKIKRDRPKLTSVVTLSAYYFPEELSSEKDRRAASLAAGSSKALESFWKEQVASKSGLGKLEELAQREDNPQDGEEGDEEEDKKKEEAGEEDGNEEEPVEDEDEYFENDDYKGNYFDDDEGYDDGGDDGGEDYGFY
ncbi:unnamed protein product [Ostreobium quekettii]|uniref:DNA-directed RNA polymerase III subunit n=1 Tax=Ostreobium quekettii TaxID=121088 RepID=A0A8S1JE21_9CHLO|nr:unnamed protein product [Ostreobium quekettii]